MNIEHLTLANTFWTWLFSLRKGRRCVLVLEDQERSVGHYFRRDLLKNFEGWKTKVTTLPNARAALGGVDESISSVRGALLGRWLVGGPGFMIFLFLFGRDHDASAALNGTEAVLLENWFRGSGCIAKGSVRVYLGLCVRLKYPVWPVSACYCYPTNCFSVSHLPSSHHLTPSFYLSCLSCSSFPSHLPLSLITHQSSHITHILTLFFFFFATCLRLFSFSFWDAQELGSRRKETTRGNRGWRTEESGSAKGNLSHSKAGLYILFALLSRGGAGCLRSLLPSPLCLAFNEGQPCRMKKGGVPGYTTHSSSCLYCVIGRTLREVIGSWS